MEEKKKTIGRLARFFHAGAPWKIDGDIGIGVQAHRLRSYIISFRRDVVFCIWLCEESLNDIFIGAFCCVGD